MHCRISNSPHRPDCPALRESWHPRLGSAKQQVGHALSQHTVGKHEMMGSKQNYSREIQLDNT